MQPLKAVCSINLELFTVYLKLINDSREMRNLVIFVADNLTATEN